MKHKSKKKTTTKNEKTNKQKKNNKNQPFRIYKVYTCMLHFVILLNK